ncbi:MAG: bifunctional phosphoglucose/phosphomannose isomerase [candidate division KSB1 bacterium]|nr:bifunctional phosphoglucose/phosphomannose isomerase [candidate division KSB1 bacterium]MDZ7366137.1 bifunctional phosphoglucose/phosphomannose isomerase [candidate division KSB1 bacterium]MDZ7404221.1 bifunctional phosphoglucose/phosphomannose isomerase [candidate division KSB1 bacterium]
MTNRNLTSAEIGNIDRADMLGRVMNMPQHFRQALGRAQPVKLNLPPEQIHNIVIAGMGGSAIGGEVVKCLTSNQLPVPLVVCRSYNLPKFVDQHTLAIISSYSGDTEETLAVFEQARQRRAPIVCITAGGKIGQVAEADHLPRFALPTGFPPRAALVHLIVPILKTLHACRFIADPTPDIDETAALLEKLGQRYHPQSEEPENSAKRLARALAERLPLIYAAEIYEAVAWRWKEQFCENSKVLAWHNVFPELNHNELVGWGLRPALDKKFQVIYLHDRHAAPAEIHSRVLARMELTQGLIEQSGVPVISAAAEGKSLLARFFSLIFLGDMTSVYLAALNRVDPTPVKKIDYLKSRMALR